MDYQEQLKRMGKYEEPKVNAKEEPKQIDWEQRRYEIAKEIMASLILANTQYFNAHLNEEDFDDTGSTYEGMAANAVLAADTLIEALQQDEQTIIKKLKNGLV